MTTQQVQEKKSPRELNSSAGSVFGTLEQVFDDIWWAWGTTRFAPGVVFPRTMTVIRERGELVLIHPILLPEAEQKKLEALGAIKHILRLGKYHGMDDLHYVKRYAPTVWSPAGCDPREGITTKELRPGGELPLEGATLFDFPTSRTPETVLLLARHGGVLLACDSVQNWETSSGCSFLGKVMASMLGFQGRACIGPGWRKQSEPKDGKGFQPEFAKLLELEFRHAIGGHGGPMKDTARDDLRASVKRVYKSQ